MRPEAEIQGTTQAFTPVGAVAVPMAPRLLQRAPASSAPGSPLG